MSSTDMSTAFDNLRKTVIASVETSTLEALQKASIQSFDDVNRVPLTSPGNSSLTYVDTTGMSAAALDGMLAIKATSLLNQIETSIAASKGGL